MTSVPDVLDHSGAIAIIGMACRFPGACTIDEFHRNLEDGVESITFFSDEELLREGVAPELLQDPNYVKAAPILQDVEWFDASFFEYSVRDAETIDPQHRIFLECAWHALESAGYAGTLDNWSIGVFAGSGCLMGTYLLSDSHVNERLIGRIASREHIGNDKDHLCTRVSYKLNLRGPSLSVQTACSTSLVAVHLACQSLLRGECDMALAGGIAIRIPQRVGYLYREGEIFSPDGHCRTFDADAQGTLFGSGGGIVVLKPLSKALADGDAIAAVIRGSAINNDGAEKFSYWATSTAGQTEAITQALRAAAVSPETIGYVEAHGTATRLGDMMEMLALKKAWQTEEKHICAIGSVKTNIGHMDSAAGIAGLIKAVLSLKHKVLYQSLHFSKPNPRIDFDHSPFYVNAALRQWVAQSYPRRAAVNSLGVGGTNAHVILEEAPVLPPMQAPAERPTHILTLSAKTAEALQTLRHRYRVHLTQHPQQSFPEVCYTANTGRAHFNHRGALVASSREEAIQQLTDAEHTRGYLTQSHPEGLKRPHIAFLCTGQGAQYVGMGRALYATQPAFRQTLDRCDEILRQHLDQPLLSVMFGDDQVASSQAHTLSQTAYTQPTLFALAYALAALWKSWGVTPDVLMGHSVGEYVAACVAGVFSLEEGLKLIAARGRLMQALPQDGTMVAVMADEAQVQAAIRPHNATVSIAAVNGPQHVVISGRDAAVQTIVERLRADGVKTRQLHVSHAFHSPLMEPMQAEFAQVAGQVTYAEPKVALVSNVTGRLVTHEVTMPDYWVCHIREAVRFADGMATLRAQSVGIFLEIGPKPTLLGMGQQGWEVETQDSISISTSTAWLPSLRPGRSDWQQMAESLSELYVRGVEVDWAGFDQDYGRRKVVLITYPFQRQRYWVEAPKQKRGREALRPLLDKKIRSPLHNTMIFETEFSVDLLPFLNDHRVYDAVVSPGACHVAMVLSGIELACDAQRVQIEDVIFPAALLLPEDGARTVQLVFTPAPTNSTGATVHFQLISFDAENEEQKPVIHATGQAGVHIGRAPRRVSLTALRQRCPDVMATALRYEALARQHIILGANFRWLDALWLGQGEVLGRLRLPDVGHRVAGSLLPPGLLDACFQVASTVRRDETEETLLPFAVKTLRLHQPIDGDVWWCYAQQVDDYKWNIQLLDITGQVLTEIVGFEMRAASAAALCVAEPWRAWLYTVEWQTRPLFSLPPDYLPTPEQLRCQLASNVGEFLAQAQTELHQHEAALSYLETVCIDYVLAALVRAGFTFEPGTYWRTGQIARQLGVIPPYHRLLHRLLQMLAEEGILNQEGELWQVMRVPEMLDPQPRISLLRERYGTIVDAEMTMLQRCGEKLGEVMRGLQAPLDLLFPGGDLSTATKLYRDAPSARVMNNLVQQVVLGAIEHLSTERGVRILEIGGGTGGTTSYLLPHLPVERTEYVFTDISAAFTIKAREKFAAYDFVHYQTLDIEKGPVEQGFAPHQYDIVVAVNVLHATKNLHETMGHVQQLLAPGGLLVQLESTLRSRWIDLIFGLTDGWWRFADWRQDHPLLGTGQWQQVLLDCGFQALTFIPDDLPIDSHQGQVVIIAQAGKTVATQDQPWLVFADETEMGQALATELRNGGKQPILVYAGARYQQAGTTTFHIRPDSADDYRHLLTAIPAVHGVVHLWALDEQTITTTADLEGVTQRVCGSVLSVVQALLHHGIEPSGLWLVTRGAQAVSDADAVANSVQSMLWGMGKVIALEHPELNCVCVDLDATATVDEQVTMLFAELSDVSPFTAREDQIALRHNVRHVARLVRYQEPTEGRGLSTPCRLEVAARGTLDNLQLQPLARRPPTLGEVEIRVRCTGLNFIDVLDVLDLLPFRRDHELGSECAGEVVAVGDDVTQYQIGDRVLAVATGSLSQYVTVNTSLVAQLPDSRSFEEAATIPINFLTAYYALHHVAGISAGDRVLIHAAAGGTGMAAVQIAQAAGAEVFGTASPGKWEALNAVGVTHLYNSRTLDFADQVMADTHGQGVDILLNSLTAEGFVEKSLAVLASNGRFLELAKRDVWSDDAVKRFRADLTYHFVDLRQLIQQEPTKIGDLLHDLLSQFVAGKLKPLPYTVFPWHDVVNAFRYMQQTSHIGKIVVTQLEAQQSIAPEVTIRDDATYLITGGLGGLGVRVARWLVEQGARHLVLIGRSQPTPDAQCQLDVLAELGAEVMVAQADVTVREQLGEVLAHIDVNYPLRGVIHAAGVLDDGSLLQQDWARFVKVLAPKVWGAWNLHTLTQEISLDFFILFSSIASLLGNRGQANHAAANTFLDAFAHYRRAQHLPALSINWGAWSEVGAAAEMVRRERQRMEAQGQGVISPERGIEVLAYLLQQEVAQAGVLPIDWTQFHHAPEAASPFLAECTVQPATNSSYAVEQQVGFSEQLAQAGPAERRDLLMHHLRAVAANVLGLSSPHQIDPRLGLMALGLDSLMAVEFRNHLVHNLEHRLPSTLIFDHPTLDALADYLGHEVFGREREQMPADETPTREGEVLPSPTVPPQSVTDLTGLSDEEATGLLLDKLKTLNL
ncbi:hypothetical protein NKDENANG_00389 [Candidatus Entotheonellaceae bacterium PAL068K]